MDYAIKQLNSEDLSLMGSLLDCFGEAFDQPDTYGGRRPDPDYLSDLLRSNTFIALVACMGDEVIGGLAAYELKKFEQPRSEIYIYDLAVLERCRRKGVATSLIERLKQIAADRGAWVIFVQADYVDEPAVKLYSKMGVEEKVLHFDIEVPTGDGKT